MSTSHNYTLSLHDALPILPEEALAVILPTSTKPKPSFSINGTVVPFLSKPAARPKGFGKVRPNIFCSKPFGDRKSTRLNSSHVAISYAVFCLKKKNIKE